MILQMKHLTQTGITQYSVYKMLPSLRVLLLWFSRYEIYNQFFCISFQMRKKFTTAWHQYYKSISWKPRGDTLCAAIETPMNIVTSYKFEIKNFGI